MSPENKTEEHILGLGMTSPHSDEEDHDSSVRDKFRKERDDTDDYGKRSKKRDRESSSDSERKDEFGRSIREKDREREKDRDKDRERERERERREKDKTRSPKESRRYSPPRESRRVSAPRGHSPPYKRERRDEPPDWDRPEIGYPSYRDRTPYYPPPMPAPMHRGPPYPEPLLYPPDQRGRPIYPQPPRPPSKTQGRSRTQDVFEGPLKTYKQFLETQDDNITPQEAEKKYEEYKVEYKKKQARTFFREHKAEEWFREKYDPTYLERQKTERDGLARANAQTFSTQIATPEAIKFSLDADAHLEEGEQIEEDEEQEEGSLSGVGLQEPGLDTEEGALPTKDEKEELDINEGRPDEEGAPGGEPREREAVNEKDDEKEKGGSKDDKDNEKDNANATDGSQSPKLISTKPAVTPRKNDKLDMALEPQRKGSEPPRDPHTLFIKTITPTCSRTDLLEVLNRVGQPGEQVCKLLLSEPMRYKNFHRIGWVTYISHDLCMQALRELNNHKFKDFELQMTINRPNTPDSKRRFKVTPEIAGRENRIAVDLEQSQALMLLMDKEKAIENNPLLSSQCSGLTPDEKLDRILYYLRFVHFFCYYCGEEFEDDYDLRRRCGTVHVRGKAKKPAEGEVASARNEKAALWVDSLDKKIKARLEKVDDPEVYCGKEFVTQALDELYRENIKKLEDEKYRCAVCNKLFRAEEFVRKHIPLKHDQSIKDSKQKGLEEQFFQNYWNDPRHINITPAQSTIAQPIIPSLPHKHVRRQKWDYEQPEIPSYMMRLPPPPMPPPVVIGSRVGGGGGGGGGGGRGSSYRGRSPNGRGRGELRYKPFPTAGRPLPPPHAGFQDPRGIRHYVDLDAPAEDLPQIDYRTGLSSDQG